MRVGKPKSKHDLKELQREWYDKLQEEGFLDIEIAYGPNAIPVLKQWDCHYFESRYPAELFKLKEDYFYQATQFLNSPHNGLTHCQMQIWELHCQGHGFRYIASRLRDDSNHLNKDKVGSIIKAIKDLMHDFHDQDYIEEDDWRGLVWIN